MEYVSSIYLVFRRAQHWYRLCLLTNSSTSIATMHTRLVCGQQSQQVRFDTTLWNRLFIETSFADWRFLRPHRSQWIKQRQERWRNGFNEQFSVRWTPASSEHRRCRGSRRNAQRHHGKAWDKLEFNIGITSSVMLTVGLLVLQNRSSKSLILGSGDI